MLIKFIFIHVIWAPILVSNLSTNIKKKTAWFCVLDTIYASKSGNGLNIT